MSSRLGDSLRAAGKARGGFPARGAALDMADSAAARASFEDHAPRPRQLRQLHLQPRPVRRRAGRRSGRLPERRRSAPTRRSRSQPAAIVISPGPCTPREAGICVPLVRAAAAAGVPLLGRLPRPPGHRRGVRRRGGPGRPAHARQDHHGGAHRAPAVRGHPVAVRGHALPLARRGARTACPPSWRSPPGRATGRPGSEIMALCHRTLPVFGVQFHPESVATDHGKRLLANFLWHSPASSAGRRPLRQSC